MPTRLRLYIVGHYRYPWMRRPRLTALAVKWADCLPPTMLTCTITVMAATRADTYNQLHKRNLCHHSKGKAA